MTFLKRRWLILAVVFGIGVVGAAHWGADWATREPPNHDEIEAGLWLGGQVAEPPPGTSSVLNLCESADPYAAEHHRWQPIRDAAPPPSLDWLRQQVAFIEAENAAGRTVFVHCFNGVSRSGMVMAAYLMRRHGWSRDEALEFLRSRRPGVRPNPVFLPLLLEWQESLASNR